MRNSKWILALAVGFLSIPLAGAQNNSAPTNGNGAHVVVARGANFRQWGKIVSQTNEAGVVSTKTNLAYTELSTGLCYTNAHGDWVDAVEVISNAVDGAWATQAGHHVHFSINANTAGAAGGAVHLVAPDGRIFDSRVYGLAYWDRAKGSNILVAPLQDAGGLLVGTNIVLYTNAFRGIDADIEYVFHKSGLEQNIIYRSQLPPPESFGLDPQSVRLEVITEFFSPPPARMTTRTNGGISDDTLIQFGRMAIGVGQAFYTPGTNGPQPIKGGHVGKHWTNLNNRDFLIEQIPFPAISNALQKLPLHASLDRPGNDVKNIAALEPLLPIKAAAQSPGGRLALAASMPDKPGVVMDYTMFNDGDSTNDYEFDADTSYISGALYITDSVGFSYGCVVKFDPAIGTIYNYGSSGISFWSPDGAMIVLTSVNDDSVGEIIDGSTGSPSTGSTTYLWNGTGGEDESEVDIANVRFAWAGIAYQDIDPNYLTFTDCEFVNGGQDALWLDNHWDVYLQNVLLEGWGNLVASPTDNVNVHAVNITEDGVGSVFDNDYYTTSGTVDITNSILVDWDATGMDHTVGPVSVAWQTGPLGDHYLPPGSTFIDEGNTTADQLGLFWFTTQTNQQPEGYSTVDLGFHYVTLDSSGNPLVDGEMDGWEIYYFGSNGLDPNASYDGLGNSLLYDYENGIDPVAITFAIEATNLYVNLTNVPLSLALQTGRPSSVAVLVDSTNFSSASWVAYTTSNLTVNIGATEGWHTVWVGLSGSSNNVLATWNSLPLDLAASAPVLGLTNMSNYTGSRPYIDPAGYANRALRSLTFAVTNSLGAVQTGQGSVVDQQCNPADMLRTTNWFTCVDLALTLGTNYVGIQAVDWAGNVTRTNFAYDFDTNLSAGAPAIALIWPQSGMQLSGSSYTLRGTVDDDTATVTGQYMDTNGNPQRVCGLVERGGQFWLENVPLYAGTNALTVTVTNAAGFGATTNLTLYQSGVTLAMDTMDTSLLNQVYVNVTGTISTNSYIVWVNGVLGTNNGDGTWSATNVPVTAGGTGSFDMAAYPSGSAPTNSSWTNFGVQQAAYTNATSAYVLQASISIDKAPVVYLQAISYVLTQYGGNRSTPAGSVSETNIWNWTRGGGGTWTRVIMNTNDNDGTWNVDGEQTFWPADAGYVPTLVGGFFEFSEGNWGTYSTNSAYNSTPPLWIETANASQTWSAPMAMAVQSSQVEMLFTGSKGLRGTRSLFMLHQDLTNETFYLDFGDGDYWDRIPSLQITLGGYGNEDTNGNVWLGTANCQNLVITPAAPSSHYGSDSLTIMHNYTLVHQTEAAALGNTNLNRKLLGVGELVDLSGMPACMQWTTTAGSLSATNGATNLFTAPSNATPTLTVTATTNGVSMPVSFGVVEPTGVDHAILQSVSNYYFGANVSGAGMSLLVYVGPTNVSFGRVQFIEALTNVTIISGYYATYYTMSQLMDVDANQWFQLNPDNSWPHTGIAGNNYDQAWWARDGSPWTPGGGFTWAYTPKWRVGDAGQTNNVTNAWSQQMTLDSDGSMTIQKYGHTVTRNTNDVYTTQN